MREMLEQCTVKELIAIAGEIGLRGDFGRLYVGRMKDGLTQSLLDRKVALDVNDQTMQYYIVNGKAKATGAAASAAAPPVAAPPVDAAVSAAFDELKRALTATAKPVVVDADQIRAIVGSMLDERNARVIDVRICDHVTTATGRAHRMFPKLLHTINTRAAGRRLHAWMTGPAGSGKSYLAKQIADASGLDFYCTGAVSDKYGLMGFINAGDNGERNLQTEFRRAFERGGLFLWDEIDASNPAALCAFNDALSNGRCAFPDKTVEQHPDFVTVAAANTWGLGASQDYVGRTKIDATSLTRFVRWAIDYDEDLERDLAGDQRDWALFVQSVRSAVHTHGLKILITPRHTIQGAALLKAGLPREDVESCTVFAGLEQATVDRLRMAARP